MEHLREMGNGWSQEFWVKILQIASSSTVLLFSTQNERKLTKGILDINQCHIMFEYYLNATLWNKINRLVCNQYSFYLLIIAKRIFIFTGHYGMEVKYIVQYGEVFPQSVYCFLMKRCWQPHTITSSGGIVIRLFLWLVFPSMPIPIHEDQKKFHSLQ